MKIERNREKLRSVDPMTVAEAIERFSITKNAQKIQLLKPFMVMPATSYSNPLTLPIGIAYLASIMELAGYEVDIIDGVGESPMKIESTGDSAFKRQGLSPNMILERVDPDCTVLC